MVVLWSGAEVARKSLTSCGWTESLSLCVIFLYILYRCEAQGSPRARQKDPLGI